MIYLEKCDVFDEVWNRYTKSYYCTVDVTNFVPKKDIDDYCFFLRKSLLRDLKLAKKEAKKQVQQIRRAARQARLLAFMDRLKSRFSRKKSETSEVTQSVREVTFESGDEQTATVPAVVVENNNDQLVFVEKHNQSERQRTSDQDAPPQE